jgi:hypothetical protein
VLRKALGLDAEGLGFAFRRAFGAARAGVAGVGGRSELAAAADESRPGATGPGGATRPAAG